MNGICDSSYKSTGQSNRISSVTSLNEVLNTKPQLVTT